MRPELVVTEKMSQSITEGSLSTIAGACLLVAWITKMKGADDENRIEQGILLLIFGIILTISINLDRRGAGAYGGAGRLSGDFCSCMGGGGGVPVFLFEAAE